MDRPLGGLRRPYRARLGTPVRVRRLVARDGPGNASDNLRCFIAVFGHGPGLPETIERVRRTLAAGTPDALRPHIAVQPALSSEPSADTPGTLYVNWLFKPETCDELAEDIYMHTLPLAISVAVTRMVAAPTLATAQTGHRLAEAVSGRGLSRGHGTSTKAGR